jgi:hypothetical protein
MIKRDSRYNLIKPMIADGKIGTFNDIFEYIPKTIIATDLGKKVDRFNKLMNKVEGFTLEEIYRIGSFCDLGERQMYELVEAEYFKSKSKIKRTKKS